MGQLVGGAVGVVVLVYGLLVVGQGLHWYFVGRYAEAEVRRARLEWVNQKVEDINARYEAKFRAEGLEISNRLGQGGESSQRARELNRAREKEIEEVRKMAR